MQHALTMAVRYLIESQAPDGHWQDYALPVGTSDAWVTAYAGFALAEAARRRDVERAGALRAAAASAEWLRTERAYPAGWGFNHLTGPDADSTAWSLRLLASLDIPVDERDVQFLLARRCDDGGFATYAEPGYWGRSQPDVSAVVFLSLPPAHRRALAKSVLAYLSAVRSSDGTWPSYWWRTCHYATAASFEFLQSIGHCIEGTDPVIADDETHGVHSAFDLACVARIVTSTGHDRRVLNGVIDELIGAQHADGSWPGADNLRVTDPDCPNPWVEPRGKRYVDQRGIITTATAIRALVHALDQTGRRPL